MTEEASKDQMKNKVYFVNLIIMLGATAMQQLGKTVNPITNKVELELQGAQATIDLLTALQAKTKGNLDDEEKRLLEQTLSALQMNYVETAQKVPEETKKEDKKESGTDAESKPDTEPSSQDSGKGKGDSLDKKDPKYHKSYE